MAGHSHWAGIKHKKAAEDAKRGKVFSKIAKQISVAARSGGGDPGMNLNLKYAIERARAANMPKDNIERAVKKGSGELEGACYEEVVYEGYGQGGVAIMLKAITDNRNRTSGEVRKLFEKHGGSLGKTGCVAWQFEMKALLLVEMEKYEEELVLDAALTGGAEDMKEGGDAYEIEGPVEDFESIKEALAEAGIETETAMVTNLPTAMITCEAEVGGKVLALLSALDDHDDIDSTDTNLDVTDEILAAAGED